MAIDTISPDLDGNGLRIGVVQARFNAWAGEELAAACLTELVALGVDEGDITHLTVPGALEIPVVSGNVSLYNETEGNAILPTPTVAVVPINPTCTIAHTYNGSVLMPLSYLVHFCRTLGLFPDIVFN